MRLEKNLGTADRVVRLIFSTTVIILFFIGAIGGPLAAWLLVLSALLMLTVVFSFCPVYRAFGLDSKEESTSD